MLRQFLKSTVGTVASYSNISSSIAQRFLDMLAKEQSKANIMLDVAYFSLLSDETHAFPFSPE